LPDLRRVWAKIRLLLVPGEGQA